MKNLTKSLLILAPFMSAAAFANTIPNEIYQPQGKLVKSENKADEFEVEYHLQGSDVAALAEKVTAHAQKFNFRVVESDIRKNEADLKFVRGNQELDVDIEVEKGHTEYKAELDHKR